MNEENKRQKAGDSSDLPNPISIFLYRARGGETRRVELVHIRLGCNFFKASPSASRKVHLAISTTFFDRRHLPRQSRAHRPPHLSDHQRDRCDIESLFIVEFRGVRRWRSEPIDNSLLGGRRGRGLSWEEPIEIITGIIARIFFSIGLSEFLVSLFALRFSSRFALRARHSAPRNPQFNLRSLPTTLHPTSPSSGDRPASF